MIRFAILSMPRTGSMMLARQLDSHPDIACYLALFSRNEFLVDDHAATAALRQALGDEWQDWDARKADPAGFLAAIESSSPKARAIGLKQHLSGPPEATMALIDGWAERIVFLTRPNHLATYSSAKLATEAGWEQRQQGETRSTAKIRFDAEEFDKHVLNRDRQDARWRPLISAAGGFEVTYAEARQREAVERIWELIGVDPKLGGEPDILKKNAEAMLDRFVNPDAVTAWLAEHDHMEWAEPEI